jgi:maltooligosyltrehalose trehalohydrolase
MTVAQSGRTTVRSSSRRLPIGAELVSEGVDFRVWAPKRRDVQVVFEDDEAPSLQLTREDSGHFSGFSPEARAAMLYRFRLDGSDELYPDPASGYQPQGVHGPSQIVDPRSFGWSDDHWRGVDAAGQVLYEIHIGTFTREGTWRAAMAKLDKLKDVGVTCLEIMPVNQFAGRFGWGYDGVQLFAPFHHYGTPDDMRAFIDSAHSVGIGAILDVVYNHLGPDGNYLPQFSDDYLSKKHHTDWGDAINFDGPGSEGVREFFLANIRYWIEEFHLDGFRFDATQAIVDDSPRHILAEITQTAREAAKHRKIYLINENEPQDTKLVRPIEQHGYGMDALWNDDFHHAAMVALSGHNEAYYTDYLAQPQEFVSAAKYGYLYQGQRYKWQMKRRGTPALDLPPTAFVHFLQNHDQIANSGLGLRAHQISSPGQFKAMTALLLLMPQTPMLFQGQEWGASSTFHYFADHNPELSKLICEGRAREMRQFPSIATPEMQACLPNPTTVETFERCKLNHDEPTIGQHAQILQLHKDLLKLRREEPSFRRVQRRGEIDGAVLGCGAFVLRYFGAPSTGSGQGHDDRLLMVNFDNDKHLDPAPEPLLAPPLGMRWSTILTTEDPKYGGSGMSPVETEQEGWWLHGRCAVVLKPLPIEQAKVKTRMIHGGSAQEAKKKQS